MTLPSSPSLLPNEELLDAWIDTVHASVGYDRSGFRWLATVAAQWGEKQAKADIKRQLQEAADQELEACCEWVESELRGQLRPAWRIAEQLRAARRPKPPSLKEQALEALAHILSNSSTQLGADTIRRALEQLPDHE